MTNATDNRRSARRTAIVIAAVALAIYAAFMASGFLGAL